MEHEFGLRDRSVCSICRSGVCSCDELATEHGVRPIGHSSDEDLDDACGGDDCVFSIMFERWINDPNAHDISEILSGSEEKRAKETRHRAYNRKQDIKRGKINGKHTGWKQQSIDEAKSKGLPSPQVVHNLQLGSLPPFEVQPRLR